MRALACLSAVLAILFAAPSVRAADPTAHRFNAAGSPMDYYVSVPAGWAPDRPWPVILALPDASRDFTKVMDAFIAARHGKPWIIVVPVVLGSGGVPWRFPETFGYRRELFEQAEKDGVCKFDTTGLAAVMQDVNRRFKGEIRPYVTGFEAAGHVIWREVIHNPQGYRAAALITPNFAGRCVQEELNTKKTTTPVPVLVLRGADDKPAFNGGPFDLQIKSAVDYVRGLGNRVDEVTVPGKMRGPFPDEVIEFFEKVRGGGAK